TMPSASIAVSREEALSASTVVALRKITPLSAARRGGGSLEGEHPRAPGARVAAPAAVAAAAAVANAHAARAAGVHAVDQFLAAAFQPVGPADAGRVDAALGRLAGAVLAEVVVGIELVAQFAHAQFDHDRVVEEAEHLDLVGDHVLGIDEIDQRGRSEE